MIADEHLPDGWTAAASETTYDEVMDREYEHRRYERADGDGRVVVHDVEEPKAFEGWGYQVVADAGADDERVADLGVFEDLDAAREAAVEYMAEHPSGS